MADINSSNTFDEPKSTSNYGSTYGSTGSKTVGESSENSLMDSINEIPGIESLKNVGTFIAENWMMLAGVGAVLGLGAYFFRDSLPLIGKKSGSHKPSKLAQMKAGHASHKRGGSRGRGSVSSARA